MSTNNLPFGELDAFNVFVEIAAGSQDKYEFDEKTGTLMLDRVLYGSQRYPANYGYVPETHAEDGDHADVLLLTTNPVVPGCAVKSRAIGFMEMVDSGESDSKIIAVPTVDPRFGDVLTLDDLPKHRIDEIRNFFETYKVLQKKEVKVGGFFGPDRAKEELQKAKDAFTSK